MENPTRLGRRNILRSPMKRPAVSLKVKEKPHKNHCISYLFKSVVCYELNIERTWKDTTAIVIMLRYIIERAFLRL